jgi:hypothetical protein
MIDQPLSLPNENDVIDWGALNSAQIELSPEQIQRAAQVSRSIRFSDQRWQVYLTALGTLGFEQWVRDRAPELAIQVNQSSIWQTTANLVAAACDVRVGAFKICVLSVGNLVDDPVSVPVAAFDLPDFAAHFYILMQVIEEEEKVAVSGFLSYEQYRQMALKADSDWTYSLPLDSFNSDANALLLNLRCLAANAIRLPAMDVTRSSSGLREKLSELQFYLQSQPAWELLSVEEGLTLLSDSTLVNSLYEVTPQPSINAGLWLRNQIDTIAQELGWMLMPVFSPLRSLREEFDSIRSSLDLQGVQIPTSARGAYRSLKSEQGSFRVYAITWMLSENPNQSEWMLLVALGAEPGADLPRSLRLEIRDETQTLFDQSLEETNRGVLYAQVLGNWDERFWVTVTADDTDVFEIPPFGFAIDVS